jgi:hypothetical protein
MSQSRTHSFLEAVVNVGIGYIVSTLAQIVIFPIYNIHIPLSQQMEISGLITLVSITRLYLVRRVFNQLRNN